MQKKCISNPSSFHPKRINDLYQYGSYHPTNSSSAVFLNKKKEGEFLNGKEKLSKKGEGKGSRPKLQYLRFEDNGESRELKNYKYQEGRYQNASFGMEDQPSPYWNIQKDPIKKEENIYYKGNPDYQMPAVTRSTKATKLIKHSASTPVFQKNKILEITFNVESTQPGQSQKQQNVNPISLSTIRSVYQFQSPRKYQIKQKSPISGFRRKIAQMQMQAKQKQYRNLIRSKSRQQGKQRTAVCSKMKQVLNHIYALKKQLE